MNDHAAHPLLAQFADQPVMIAPEHLGQVKALMAAAARNPDFQKALDASAVADDGFWPDAGSWKAPYRPYTVARGVLQIPIRGILLNGFSFATPWATGYEYIWRAFERGLADDTVRGIALLSNSPGGFVAENQDTVDKMYVRRDEKPLRGFAHESAYSAAYNILSVAPHIAVSRTGGVGSIGVMTSHIDWSKWNENFGIDYTFIFAGKHKVDGNPEEPLSEAARSRLQSQIDELYGVFVASVARNRGIDERVIRATEAQCYSANQAVSEGLADSIGSLEDATSAFAETLDAPSDNQGEEAMADEQAMTAAHQAAIDTARAEGHAEGLAAGAKAEQERFAALAKLDTGSKVSTELTSAIIAGTSAGDFAIALVEGGQAKLGAAAAAAAAEAAGSGELPTGGTPHTPGAKVNRGAAYAEAKAARAK